MHARPRDDAVMPLGDQPVPVGARRHLRAVRDDQQLRLRRQPRQPLADRRCHRAADAAVDLVEDHRARAAFLGQRHLQRQDEAGQLAARRDLHQRRERRTRIGGNLELDTVAPGRAPPRLRQRIHHAAEPRGIQLERGKLPRHRRVEPGRRQRAQRRQRRGGVLIGAARGAGGCGQRRDARPARLHPRLLRLQLGGQFGQRIRRGAMLARQRPQFEQPRLHRFQPVRIKRHVAQRRRQPVFGLRCLDHRPVHRRQRLRQHRMFRGQPVQPARCLPQIGQRAVRSVEMIADRGQIVRQPRALLHRAAFLGQRLLLARLRAERGQFGHRMLQPFPVAFGRLQLGPGRRQRRFGRAPCTVRGAQRTRIDPSEHVEQIAVPLGVQQAAIVMLAVNLHQHRADLAQQPGGGGLIVDAGAAAAVGLHDPADHHRFAGLDLEPVLRQQRERTVVGAQIEGGRHHRLRRALPHQPAFGALAQRQPQRIEQDGFSGPGFPGQRAQPRLKIQVQCLDQHDVADGKGR